MTIRESCLPSGWYPRTPNEIERFLSGFESRGRVRAAISPHAGWYFSGRIAAKAVSSLDREADTVVVIGGHLPSGRPLYAMEDAVQTPLGPMLIDRELRGLMLEGGKEDVFRDNTIEVLLPMVKYFFPNAMLLWVRLPAIAASFEAGKKIALLAKSLKKNINVLASTDLTHYGSNYGYAPMGYGAQALKWVKEVNDRNFINAVESGKPEDVLSRAAEDMSSCSAGAVLGAMGFAAEEKTGNAKLLEYATSADIDGGAPDSFVGYAAFAFE
jgi:AmmeMemoRadiSam system protein B